ncbi:LysR family transcriptional regulator [Nesterenkonia aerolata]|uniref:LysR family transcriptional regulator n=1 Tax=Nesterenkonia aerolata TaxID=3074079 RepID=A0ABU2DS10_9MICC|nr:LysR family transcriptional regulator [Nesterenkonia sp. LY-0111]MDR8019291.1 LysR family transcriptional regulator [Nesterenkonia sp. LY-0111]
MEHSDQLSLRRLHQFLTVVDRGTVTRAAEELHMAQPALSRQIKALERELHLRLFEPEGNRLALTPTGRAFVPVAQRLMREARGLSQAVDALQTGRVSSLTVAATAASIRSVLAPFVATMSPEDPMLISQDHPHFELDAALRLGADMAISPVAPAPHLRSVPLAFPPIRAVAAPDHRLFGIDRETIAIGAFRDEHVILPSTRSVSRLLIDGCLSDGGVTFSRITECDDAQTSMALTAAGHGVALVTEPPQYGLRDLVVLPEDGEEETPLHLPLHVTWLPGHHADGTIRAVAERLHRFLHAEESTGWAHQ